MNRLALIALVLIIVGLAGLVIPRVADDWYRDPLEPGPNIQAVERPSAWYIDVPAGILVGAGVFIGLFGIGRSRARRRP